MKELRALFRPLTHPLPDDTQCPKCRFFDTEDPRVRQILKENYPQSWDTVLFNARCKCESLHRAEQEKERNRWNFSNIPNRFGNATPNTFRNFKQVEGTESAYQSCQNFILRRGKRILTLVGTYGSGKSHLLEAVARDFMHDGYSVRYEYVPSMLNELRSTVMSSENNGSLWTKLQERFAPKLLILDDLGQESPTEWTRKTLTEIVDERIRTNGYLLCATNYTQDQLRERIDERFVSRLFDRSEVSVLTCSTYANRP